MNLTYRFIAIIFSVIRGISAFGQTDPAADVFDGTRLFAAVEKYVSLGEHRTGTPADFATSEWLAKELKSSGYDVKYTEFTLKQFFLEDAVVTDPGKNSYNAFPLWYVSDSIKLNVTGELALPDANQQELRNKIVLLKFSFGEGGLLKRLQELTEAGVAGIIGYQENETGEIAAINAPKAARPWKVPIVLVSPGDARNIIKNKGKAIRIIINGTFKDVTARNVYGEIGKGEQHIVISTPISGWFTCGGERGPGVAAWLALSKWAAAEKLPYTFVFTGNSGHELGGWGAKTFLEEGAPPVHKTKLWIHLGAGIATHSYRATTSGLIKENAVDGKRNFFYSESVKRAFGAAFENISGNKFDIKERAGGELIYVIDNGYPNVLGASYAHTYFHMRGDDSSTTSPEMLREISLAFRNFILKATEL